MRWALLLVLAGCGPEAGAFTCPAAPGWSFELEPRCGVVRHNLEVAEQLLGEPLPSARVVVLEAARVGEAFGNYDARWGITLGCDGLAYLHELMHLQELEAGQVLTFMHPDWSENGRADRDRLYETTAWRLGCP